MKKFLLSIFAVLFAFAGVQAQSYVKVTSAPVDWSGDYLIVYEDGNVAFNGSLTTLDAVSNTIPVTISNGEIEATDATNAAKFTIVSNGDGTYTVQSSSGYYIGQTSNANGLASDETISYDNTLSLSNEGTANISSGGAYLRFNAASNQNRFRYYKSGSYTNQQAIALYKYTDGVAKAATPTVVGGEFVGSTTVTITNNSEAEGATVYYKVGSGEIEQFTGASKEFTIVENTTIVAYAQIGDDEETRSATVTAEFTRVAADPELVYDATSFNDEITVSVTSDDDVYYTLDGTEPNAESTPYETALTLKATAMLKVVAIDADGYASAVKEQKFTKNESASGAGSGTATLVTDASTLAVGDKVVILNSEGTYALSTTQSTNNRKAVEAEATDGVVYLANDIQILTLENGLVEGQLAFQTGSGYLYAASTSSNHLKTKATLDNKGSFNISIDAAGIATIKADQTSRNWLRFNENNGSPIFSCYTSGQTDVSIYKVTTIEVYTLSVSAAGWATLFLNYDAEIPEGVTCYAVSAVDGEYATLAPVDGVIPANTGVIVKANEGSYTFEVATEEGSDVDNELIGTTVNTYITKEAYVLSAPDGIESVGLYKAEMAGGVWLNNANKAYLPASVANGAASYSFRFGEGTTGISEVKGESGNVKVIYDLTGRRVENPSNGIYIINGVKTLVK